MRTSVSGLKHPLYTDRYRDWQLWRDVYESGQKFIDKYLEKFSSREGADDYARRKKMTYCPAFAKEAVNEIKNSIFQRFVDISRRGGSGDYQDAVQGLRGGVDLLGSSMNSFIGRQVLPELLVMQRVGVYVDMPAVTGQTLAEAEGARPYIYIYCPEDIRSWCYDEESSRGEFSHLLLMESYNTYDAATGLTSGTAKRYRHMWVQDGGVYVQYYDSEGYPDKSADIKFLNVPRIPFVVAELSDSIIADAAKYQVGLLNLASADMAYSLSMNFPFYTEQFEPRAINEFTRKSGASQGGEASDGQAAKTDEIKVGVTRGRRYPKGMERPGFIHPSSEPLNASMDKQEQMKREIRQLVNLAVSNLQPVRMASAESKGMDRQGLESGLSYIGLELEHLERKIADYWSMYEGSEPATIYYPTNYSVKSDEESRREAEDLKEMLPIIPSRTFQRVVCKRIAELTVGRQVDADTVERIRREIDGSDAMTVDPEVIFKSVEVGLLDLDLASKLLGYPPGSVERASEDHLDRLERIAKTQMKGNDLINGAARGVEDLDDGSREGVKQEQAEGRDTTQDDTVKKKVRGRTSGV